MNTKIILALALVSAAAGRPDKLPRYQYQAPESESVERTYTPPTYQPPVNTYTAPQESEHHDSGSKEYDAIMPYEFGFTVERENNEDAAFGHKSTSDGNQVIGQYRVELPDCTTQIVTYTADNENGFQAEVKYEGEPCEYVPPVKHESAESAEATAPRATYEAPQASYEAPRATYEAPSARYAAPARN